MFWLPPVRFSTTAGWLQAPCRPWAMARAMVSGEPPGVSGTMILTGRSGNACASASELNRIRNPDTSQRVIVPSAMLHGSKRILPLGPFHERLLQACPVRLGWATPHTEEERNRVD